jgi:hypothetical protein
VICAGASAPVNAWRPLEDDVRANAVAAAFHDPRFEPLSRSEFADTSIEVSLLGPREAIVAADEDAVRGAAAAGCGRRRARMRAAPRDVPAPGVGATTGARAFLRR